MNLSQSHYNTDVKLKGLSSLQCSFLPHCLHIAVTPTSVLWYKYFWEKYASLHTYILSVIFSITILYIQIGSHFVLYLDCMTFSAANVYIWVVIPKPTLKKEHSWPAAGTILTFSSQVPAAAYDPRSGRDRGIVSSQTWLPSKEPTSSSSGSREKCERCGGSKTFRGCSDDVRWPQPPSHNGEFNSRMGNCEANTRRCYEDR